LASGRTCSLRAQTIRYPFDTYIIVLYWPTTPSAAEIVLMKITLLLIVALPAALVAGCMAPKGYHYETGSFTATPNDPCMQSFVNSKGFLSWVNSSAGKPKGVSHSVTHLSGTTDASATDLMALKLPYAGEGAGSQAAIACYATAHFQDGTSEDGLIDISAPGDNQPINVVWVNRHTVERARAEYAARTEKGEQDAITANARMQTCTFRWRVALQAKSLMASGWTSQDTSDHLISEYAYGPDGQVFRDSDDVAALIQKLTNTVAMTPAARAANHIPDYASYPVLSNCLNQHGQQVH
jgi:Signal transduction histidine kinase regulating citrate/malate metabolism